MSLRILCDFDGTIALDDVTDRLLDRFALPEWHAIEEDWLAGRIGSRQCMARQVALLRCERAELDTFLDTLAIDPGFPAFVTQVQALGAELAVVSDGLDYAIHRMLARCGLDQVTVIANRLEFLGEDRYGLAFPHARADCAKASGTCKCAVARQAGTALPRLLIGDGTSDFCAAGAVDMVLAKDRLLDHCRAHGLPHRPFSDFAEATRLLPELARLPGTAPAFRPLFLEPA